MHDPYEFVAHYLERLRQGQVEEAFFALIEGDPLVLSALMEAFRRDENREIRAELVHCIWQYRRPEVIGFLAQLLDYPEEAVWQKALDGLVAIGGPEAIRRLQEARMKLADDREGRVITAEWIDEALEQLREQATHTR